MFRTPMVFQYSTFPVSYPKHPFVQSECCWNDEDFSKGRERYAETFLLIIFYRFFRILYHFVIDCRMLGNKHEVAENQVSSLNRTTITVFKPISTAHH